MSLNLAPKRQVIRGNQNINKIKLMKGNNPKKIVFIKMSNLINANTIKTNENDCIKLWI